MISEKALEEYKALYKEEFGEEISNEKAMDEAVSLLTMFDAIYRPVKKSWLKEIDEKDTLPDKSLDTGK